MSTIRLTGAQCALLAEHAGYTVEKETDPMITDLVQVVIQDEKGTEILEDDDSVTMHRTVVYDEECKEEGLTTLDSGDPGGLV